MLREVARFAAGNANGFFEVYPTHLDEFAKLISVTAINWGLCIVADRFLSNLVLFTGSSAVLTIAVRGIDTLPGAAAKPFSCCGCARYGRSMLAALLSSILA